VGAFFDGFFQAQGYYRFVGAAQLLAAFLLLFRATAPLGSMIYFPIALNIFVITVTVGFGGTAVVTGMMTLASAYLLCWYYDRWKALVPGFSGRSDSVVPREPMLQTIVLTVAAAVGFLGVTGVHLARLRDTNMYAPATLVLIGGAIALAAAFVHLTKGSGHGAARGDRAELTR
jgi:hypothetical protein